ncbi:unnamed protein product [Brassica rapa]|uniref:Uncharacterized protein n=2 Tax=Brassica TaxID=3705 RepID=A0A8D9GVH5_BRACM|nr:unnamed protein product [Brassica napus]CAG7887705.1 unnamed protein product [Brassica rapa]
MGRVFVRCNRKAHTIVIGENKNLPKLHKPRDSIDPAAALFVLRQQRHRQFSLRRRRNQQDLRFRVACFDE